MVRVTCLGGVGSVTGSNYLIESSRGKKVLVACGLFQGGRQMERRNWEDWGFDPKGVETLFLTHAHIDHSGKIPKLVKDGFQGRIITSPPTAELCEIMLLDAAHIQEMDAEWQSRKNKRQNRGEIDPLYAIADAEATLGRLHPVKISWKKWSKTSRTNTMPRTPRYNGCAKSPRMNMLSVPALKLTPWPRSWASRLPKGKYATLAGFLLEKEGEIPPPGTLIRVKGISFTIESSNPQAIQEVYVRW